MKVSLEYNRILSYLTYINQTPIIENLSISSEEEFPHDDLAVSIEWEHDIVARWEATEIDLEPGQTVRISFDRFMPIQLMVSRLVALTEGFRTAFTVKVFDNEKIWAEKRREVQVLAYNQWLGTEFKPNLIASFITPNHPVIAQIVSRAGEVLRSWNNSFTGYQTQDKNDVIAQMKAIYWVLQNMRINYVGVVPSFEQSGQRVRLAEEVVTNKIGNCLELAILYCSCLEYVGLHAMLLFFKGHAYAGCWLEEKTFYNCLEEDETAISKRLAKGMKSIELVETTMLTNPQPIEYETAVKTAEDNLLKNENFKYALDVAKARTLGVRPLPQNFELMPDQVYQPAPTNTNVAAPQVLEQDETPDMVGSQKRTRLKVWESKLLNLTLRNNLLNFRPTKRSISILEGDINELENFLSTGQEFSLVPCPEQIEQERRSEKEYSFHRAQRDDYREYMNAELKNGRMVTLLDEKELDESIKALYYAARTELEENGANTLFLALGFLKWFETDLSKQPRYAPILLYPIELIRKSSLKGYVIRYREEDVQINTTLLEKLRLELNLEFPTLETLPTDEQGVNLQLILNTMRTAVLHKKGWDVVDAGYIGLFSFNQFVMWNDIRNRSQELMDNPIVSSLMEGKMTAEIPPIIKSEEIDQSDYFFQNAVLMDADSSQLRAVYSASEGCSFVLHGPPGTGKSQTITNIIASALYHNKSVLFVAEKMAALSVVQARLEKVGLGDFALEIHSNKSKKGEVLAKLGKTLGRKKNGEIKQIREKRENLKKVREEIFQTTEELHKIRENGYSIYDMIAFFEKEPAVRVVPIGDLASKVTRNLVESSRQLIDRFLPVLEEAGQSSTHPLCFIRNYNLSFKEREELKNRIFSLADSLQGAGIGMGSPFDVLAQNAGLAVQQEAANLNYELLQADNLIWQYIESFGSKEPDRAVEEMIAKGRQYRALYERVIQEFNEAVLNIDANLLLLNWNFESQKWFLTRSLGQNRVLKQVAIYSKVPGAVIKENIAEKLSMIADLQKCGNELMQYQSSFANMLQDYSFAGQTDWNRLESAYQATMRVLELLQKLYRHQNAGWSQALLSCRADWQGVKQRLGDFAEMQYRKYQQINQVLAGVTELAGGPFIRPDQTAEQLRNQCIEAMNHYHRLDQWLAYIGLRQNFDRLGIGLFAEMVEKGELSRSEMKSVCTKSLMYYGVVEALDSQRELVQFNHHNFEYLMEQYKNELKLVTEMTRLELLEKLIGNIPQPTGEVNINSELGTLKKAIKNGGRGVSLRKLFDMTPNVLRKIAPCMLMSPISIAQYIDTAFPKFDLVIFDEASQVNTHEAVGAIARGNQLVVVGDPNQLSPTSFFKGDFEDEEMEFDEIDQKSILDECQSISFPELHLKWHYRSSHESLIAFSNSQYYGNQLYTFPSFNDLESKVRLVEVEGYYDRSGTKQNDAESAAIIAEVERRLGDERLRQESIGIVTFSSVQQKLIQKELDDLFLRRPELEEFVQSQSEEIFVKNLENVQGDERDVILFSVGYGPDKSGKVTMNFGPLNQEEGWKRLNVVVSRSRNEMIVFSTLRPEQIDLSRTASLGVAGLKRFLEFARNKNSLTVEFQGKHQSKDELLDAIAAELETAGYGVVRMVGKSNYRIDIGIKSPIKDTEYMAAIVLDGYRYHKTPTVRDKVVVQPFMLKRLKWNVIRVWTLEWFKNKEEVMARIRKELEEIRQKLENPQTVTETETLAPKAAKPVKIEFVKNQTAAERVYEAYPLMENQYAKEAFYEPLAMTLLVRLVKDLVEFEAPIIEEDLQRRLMAIWGINQLSTRVVEVLKEVTVKANVFYQPNDEKNTIWKSREQFEEGVVPRRYQTDKRKFNFICDAEIDATIELILKQQVSLDLKNLSKEVFRFHGYNTLGEEAQGIVMSRIARLMETGKIMQEEDRYVLNAGS